MLRTMLPTFPDKVDFSDMGASPSFSQPTYPPYSLENDTPLYRYDALNPYITASFCLPLFVYQQRKPPDALRMNSDLFGMMVNVCAAAASKKYPALS